MNFLCGVAIDTQWRHLPEFPMIKTMYTIHAKMSVFHVHFDR